MGRCSTRNDRKYLPQHDLLQNDIVAVKILGIICHEITCQK